MSELSINKSEGQSYMWFTDLDLNNYEKLKSMYPRFYDRIIEMQEILKAQGLILDDLTILLELVLNNMFIVSMDEEHVSALEDFLNIKYKTSKTLRERKLELMNHFRGYGKISTKIIEEIANQNNLSSYVTFNERIKNDIILDTQNCDEGDFLLHIKLNVPKQSNNYSDYSCCVNTLDVRLPAHLKKIYDICFNTDSKVGIAMVSVLKLRIDNDCNTNVVDELTYLTDGLGNMLIDGFENVLLDRSDC